MTLENSLPDAENAMWHSIAPVRTGVCLHISVMIQLLPFTE